MENSEIPGNDSKKAAHTIVPHDQAARAAEPAGARGEKDRPARRTRAIGSAERDRLLKDARNISFPIGLRGYERAAVDRYVERVNRLLAELEMSSSPESAVRHALDEVSEETRDILQRAHETADEITARSRARADDRLQEAERDAHELYETAQQQAAGTREAAQQEAQRLRELTTGEARTLRETAQREAAELRDAAMHEMVELKETAVRESQQLRAAAQRDADETRGSARREADEMLEKAETRTRELARSAEAIWRERRRLIDDMQEVGEQLVAIGEVEGKRFLRHAEEVVLGTEPGREQTSTIVTEAGDGDHEAAKT